MTEYTAELTVETPYGACSHSEIDEALEWQQIAHGAGLGFEYSHFEVPIMTGEKIEAIYDQLVKICADVRVKYEEWPVTDDLDAWPINSRQYPPLIGVDEWRRSRGEA